MWETKHQQEQEEPEIRLLEEWLPKISGEYRAYIKGATQALLYAQEGISGTFTGLKTDEILTHG